MSNQNKFFSTISETQILSLNYGPTASASGKLFTLLADLQTCPEYYGSFFLSKIFSVGEFF